MPRTVSDVVQEGGGYRISWSDGTVDQLVWSIVDGRIGLCKNPPTMLTGAEAEEIVNSLALCQISSSLVNTLTGIGQVASQSLALSQVGDAVVQNAWTRLIFDTSIYNRDDSMAVSATSDGVVTLPYGVYHIQASVLMHDTGGVALSDIALHIYDEDNAVEYPGSFSIANRIALANAPLLLNTQCIVEVSSVTCDVTRSFSIRARSGSATTAFGAHANSVPTGSTNYVGSYIAFKIS